MATYYKIPISNDTPDQVFSVVLGGNSYRLRIFWNERFAYWSMDVLEADETPILLGLKLVENYPICARFQDARLPTGQLFMLRENGSNARTSFDELGVNVNLYYYEPDVIAPVSAIKRIEAETSATIGTIWDSGLTEWDTGSTTWDM